nr:NADH dehydrogenase subunit 6 [Aromia bungii]UUL71584.1 NADH dehydrogenase subunit 6 [Aromia bungii]UZA66538.1 NADH dehydrogenase subunit 6 [Aromia bungii]
MFLILTTMVINSMMFLFMTHPLSLGLILLIQTLLIALMTGIMSLNFWFSYILFLIMVGGMLILFIYMTSVASNEKFKFSFKILVYLIMMMIGLLIMNFWADHSMMYKLMNIDLNKFLIMYSSSSLIMSKYMNLPSSLIFLSMIIYLLITLIVVVKISNINSGPLRQKF